MDAVELPEALQRLIAQQVADGRAASAAAFVEEAVRRLVDDAEAEDEAVRRAADAGIADAAAGRVTTVATEADAGALRARIMERLRAASGA